MGLKELLRGQWQGYPRYHRTRGNLLLHIIVVPLFLVGNLALLLALARRSWLMVVVALLTMAASVAVQGRGHRQEPVPPEPFASALEAVARILCEQWITFPRFEISGGWLNAWRQA